MKRLCLLLLAASLLSSAVGCCCAGGGCGRPLLGMGQPYQQGFPAGVASAPGCSCGY